MDNIPSTTLATFLAYSRASHDLNGNLNRMLGVDADYNRVLATSLNDESPVRCVLSDEGESQLVTRKFTEKDECDTCPIFHTEFEIDEEVTELPCGHIFLPEGIEKWLKEEKAECPVCRFKLTSKEVTRERPGVEQWAEDRTEISASRAALATNLRRLAFPAISRHPFGPASHRIANVIHEDDDRNDVMRALAMTFEGQPSIENIIRNHTRTHDTNRTLYVNDNDDDHPSYTNIVTNRFELIHNNLTTPMTYISTSTFPIHSHDNVTTYVNSQYSPHDPDVLHQEEEDPDISSQENH